VRRRLWSIGFDPLSTAGQPDPYVDDLSLPVPERLRRWDAWMEQRQYWLDRRVDEARADGWADAEPDHFSDAIPIPDRPWDESEI
jgi:hypothetical protein